MEFRLAKIEEIDEVLKLHTKYQIDTIKEEDKRWFCNYFFKRADEKFDFRRRGTL